MKHPMHTPALKTLFSALAALTLGACSQAENKSAATQLPGKDYYSCDAGNIFAHAYIKGRFTVFGYIKDNKISEPDIRPYHSEKERFWMHMENRSRVRSLCRKGNSVPIFKEPQRAPTYEIINGA
ncbi:MAG: hypothetical protein DI551_02415 [Micavibrio aeruginosavorus]|uniref:Lipoprotein n=1 Tax=Micavibrio aeruginosavorus TaxID=349221 RepID=A0A2W5N6U8_9BACT|nr:MAG: hypothetical protein DI551_02415 [Micavibrio aeruginosavorus]